MDLHFVPEPSTLLLLGGDRRARDGWAVEARPIERSGARLRIQCDASHPAGPYPCGSFFDLHGTGMLGCGWRRDRGPEVCSNELRIGTAKVEERLLGAIRDQILVPEEVVRVVERALARASELLAADARNPDADRKRLAEIEGAIEPSASTRAPGTSTPRCV
jgi:hypothetical protein